MSIIKRATRVTLEGRGEVTLKPADYITQGGEGAIYRKDKHVIKLYLDSAKMKQSGHADKVRLLAKKLHHPSIVAPTGAVFDGSGAPIGFYMPLVSGEAFPRLFTNNWRDQHGFETPATIALTQQMHEVVAYAHTQQALMADANELNWLADVSNIGKPVPYIIDVDSWQIDRFKAAVIMPSIRDWHSQGFSKETDWFAWGVVTFNLFTGIHPYKGALAGYKVGELERRMKDNASVFLKDVRLNKAVRDFSQIPGPLLDWYDATFTQGVRTTPPSPTQTGKTNTQFGKVLRMVTTATGGLVYRKLFEKSGEKVVSVWPCGVVRTDKVNLYDVQSQKLIGQVTGARIAVVAKPGGWLVVEEIGTDWNWRLIERSGKTTPLTFQLQFSSVIRSDERLFAVTDDELIEIGLHQFAKPLLTHESRWQIMGQATKWYSGIGVSNVLGALHLIVPFGEKAVAMVRTPELDTVRVVGAKAGNRFVEVITINQNGDYEALGFSFSEDYRDYTTHRRTVDGPEQNLTVLPKGVVAEIPTDGTLVLTVPRNGTEKRVDDKDLATDMHLARIGDQVVYRKDGALWSLSMQ
jgi:hypothetical protein